MKKTKKMLILSLIAIGAIGCTACIVTNNQFNFRTGLSADETYQIILDSANGRVRDSQYNENGEVTVDGKTVTGYPVTVGYKNALSNDNCFAQLKANVGQYYNTTAITNIKEIIVDFTSTDAKGIKYAVGKKANPQNFQYSADGKIILADTAKDNYYFTLAAGENDVVLKKVTIKYSCATYISSETKEIEVNINKVASDKLHIGATLDLTATVLNNVDNLPIIWVSSNPTVASINANGKVKGLKVGTTDITAKVGDVVSTKLTLTIEDGEVLPESVSLSAKKAVVGVGEDLVVTATVLPEYATDKTVTLSTDSLKVQIDGMTITGLMLTDADEEVVITATTSNNKVGTLKLKVVSMYDSRYPEVQARVAASTAVEKTALKTAKYEYTQTDSAGKETEKTIGNYEIFNDESTFATELNNGDYTQYTNAKDGETIVYTIKKGKSLDNLTYDSKSKIYPITETGGSGKLTPEEAADHVSLVNINDSSVENYGVGGYTLKKFVNLSSGFANADSKALFKYNEINENKFEMSSYFQYSSNFLNINLTVEFATSGLITSAVYVSKEYDYDWDTDKVGDLLKINTYRITAVEGERVAGAGKAPKKADLTFTDYTLGSSSTNPKYYDVVEASEFEVGDKAYFYIKEGQPSTASELFDELEVVKASNPSAITLPSWGSKNNVTLNKAVDDLVITVKTKTSNISKDIHIKVKNPVLTNFKVKNLVDTDFDVSVRDFYVSPTPSNAQTDLTVTIDPATNTAGAVVTKVKDNKYSISCANEGAYTVKVVDKTLGEAKAYTKTVTVLKASEEFLAKYVAEATKTLDYNMQEFALDYVEGTNGGTIHTKVKGIIVDGTYEIKKNDSGKYEFLTKLEGITDETNVSGYTFRFFDIAKQQFDKIIYSYNYMYDLYKGTINIK